MDEQATETPSIRYYYVDESGDGVIFDRNGKVILGKPGCSNCFILGSLDAEEPLKLEKDLNRLRDSLIADPYFQKVPSLNPGQRKTFLGFHAKDDMPEIRREVFRILLNHELRFFAVVKRMRSVLEYAEARKQKDPSYRYHPNELYEYTVRLLFITLVHKHDEYRIYFARRHKSNRTDALREQLLRAQKRFCERWKRESTSKVSVVSRNFYQEAGLQAVDYFLWALQRFYERREERYIEYLWPKVSLVRDVDDTRRAKYGEYYTREKPLTIAALEQNPEI